MKTLTIVLSALLFIGCSRESTPPVNASADTNTITIVNETPLISPSTNKAPPTWYVFKIKQLHKVTHSDDRTFAVIEGVTMQDKEFKLKIVWHKSFAEAHRKFIDDWAKRSAAEWKAGVPYVISGEVLSRDPLTIEEDTMVTNGENFGAPPENVY